MKKLDRYIAKTVLSAIGLVTLLLAGLQIFILFVNQLQDLGRLDYGILQACLFVLLQLPYQIYLFFPMASLLGSLIGLGMMANHSELIVMRASGMSIGQITTAVLKASLVLILFVTLIGETLVPSLAHYANDYKINALSGGQSLRMGEGMWLRFGSDFISIGQIMPKNILNEVYQFRFDTTNQLQLARYIRQAQYDNGVWTAYNVNQTEFEVEQTRAQTHASMIWDVPIKPQILKISGSDPDEMSLHELNQYLREQKRGKQTAANYQLAFLQRLIQPITTMVMIILAIPFIFGPLRSSSMGSKLLVGATVGFSFHILNHFLGPVSMVFQWPPALAAFGPTFIFALLGIFLMKRVR